MLDGLKNMGKYIKAKKLTRLRGLLRNYAKYEREEVSKNNLEKKIILTGGCFDILHGGHIYFLQNIRKTCTDYLLENKIEEIKKEKKTLEDKSFEELSEKDKNLEIEKEIKKYEYTLFVNIVNDKRVKFYKGDKRPVNEAKKRASVISAIEGVNYAFINPHFTLKEEWGPTIQMAKIIKPDLIVSSKSWDKEIKKKLEDYLEYKPEFVEFKGELSSAELHTTNILLKSGKSFTKDLLKIHLSTMEYEHKNILENDRQYLSLLSNKGNPDFYKKEIHEEKISYINDFLNNLNRERENIKDKASEENKESSEEQKLRGKFEEYSKFLSEREKDWKNYPKILEQIKKNYNKTLDKMKKMKK